MLTPLPVATAQILTAPAHVTATRVAALQTQAVTYAAAHPAICIDCSGVTQVDVDAVAPLAALATAVAALGVTVHLYDVPPAIAIVLGAAVNAFTSATLSSATLGA